MATTFVQLFIQVFEDCTLLYSLAVFIKVGKALLCMLATCKIFTSHWSFDRLTVEIVVVGQVASSAWCALNGMFYSILYIVP